MTAQQEQNIKSLIGIQTGRLQDLYGIYGTVIDLSSLYQVKIPAFQSMPNPVDFNFMKRVFDAGVLKSIQVEDKVLMLPRYAGAILLFCRHYAMLEAERWQAEILAQDEQANAVIREALTGMWQNLLSVKSEDEAKAEMKSRFPGQYGFFYRDLLNESYKIATDGH